MIQYLEFILVQNDCPVNRLLYTAFTKRITVTSRYCSHNFNGSFLVIQFNSGILHKYFYFFTTPWQYIYMNYPQPDWLSPGSFIMDFFTFSTRTISNDTNILRFLPFSHWLFLIFTLLVCHSLSYSSSEKITVSVQPKNIITCNFVIFSTRAFSI